MRRAKGHEEDSLAEIAEFAEGGWRECPRDGRCSINLFETRDWKSTRD